MKQSNDSIQLYNFFNKINNISKSKIDYKNIVFIFNILKIIEKSYYQSKNFNNIKFNYNKSHTNNNLISFPKPISESIIQLHHHYYHSFKLDNIKYIKK